MSEWTRLAQPVRCVVELDKPLITRRERWALVQGDQNANAIVAELYQTSGVPFDLAGCTATLTFVRPDNFAVPPIQAEITENVAVATLTDICYRVSGVYAASLQIAKNGQERTVLRLVGDVLSTENNGTVSDEQILPTPEELLNTLIEVEQARSNAVAAADEANKAASNADSATLRANQAASAIENASASAETLATGQPATVSVNGMHFTFGLPRGEKGEKGDPGNVENVNITSIAGLPEALEGKQPKGDYLPADGTAVDSEKLGGKAPEYYIQPRNLLDNSDFRNPVNQRADTAYSENAYTIDRWLLWNGRIAVNNGYIGLVGSMCQLNDGLNLNKTYTFAVYDGTAVYTVCGSFSAGATETINNLTLTLTAPNGLAQTTIKADTSNAIVWAALYEGEYTADNLPPYVYKGYAAELMECQRYYQISSLVVMANESGFVPMSIAMRVKPSVECQVLNGTGTPTATAHSTKIIQVISRDSYAAIKAIMNADL